MLDIYERFALDLFVSSYPEDKTFIQIMDMIEEPDSEIPFYDPFIYLQPEEMTGLITELEYGMRTNFISREKLQEEIGLALLKREKNNG
jgi:hypothetical protein